MRTRAAAASFSRVKPIAAVKEHRLNEEITATSVRLIGPDGEQIGVVPIGQAQDMAVESDLDLVEIVPDAKPPVCRVMDYGKFRFELGKKASSARKKQKQIQIKEIKFRPGTDEGDYQVKLKSLQRFLGEGDKTKVTLRFRGREMAHPELGSKLLARVERDLAEISVVEQQPKMEGRLMVMLLAPKRK